MNDSPVGPSKQEPPVTQTKSASDQFDPSLSLSLDATNLPYLQTIPAQAVIPNTKISVQLWQGLYPPPDVAERYEKILPGALAKIFAMTEQVQQSQFHLSNQAQLLTSKDMRRGHYLGFIVAITSVIAALGSCMFGAYFNSNGAYYVAPVFLSVPIISVALALINNSKSIKAAPLASAPEQTVVPVGAAKRTE